MRLLFDAFPYQKYGASRGTVTAVSRVPTEPTNLDSNLGIEEPVFRIRVRIDEMAPRVPADQRAMRPGMTLNAHLELERRSLWEVLFGPVLGALARERIQWPWSQRMRPLLQTEAAECGLASVAMIGLHYGHRVNLSGLRQRYPTSIKGMTLGQLMAVASDLELAPRAVRLEIDELDKLRKPAILHWDLNHFVVLESAGPRDVVILDPAVGRRKMSLAKFGRHFTGVALELTPTADFRPIEARTRTRLKDLWSRLTNYRGALIQILSCRCCFSSPLSSLPSICSWSSTRRSARAIPDCCSSC